MMITSRSEIIKVAPFFLRNKEIDKMGFLQKILLIINGKLVSFLFKNTSKNIFCAIFNLIYRNDGKIYFEDNKYIKRSPEGRNIAFPNKRVMRLVNDYKSQITNFANSYFINDLNIKDTDTIVDCGANVGELNIALKEKGLNVNYIAFEPEKEIYKSLVFNNSEKKSILHNIGLSNETTTKKLYSDISGGNSSFVEFGISNFTENKVTRLDTLLDNTPIKLFKLDAEGYEPEVLEGCEDIFKNIQYISVDFGNERGVGQENTIAKVNKILQENNFSLIKVSNVRLVGLYKNNLIRNIQ